jgi:hypothetical protein
MGEMTNLSGKVFVKNLCARHIRPRGGLSASRGSPLGAGRGGEGDRGAWAWAAAAALGRGAVRMGRWWVGQGRSVWTTGRGERSGSSFLFPHIEAA